MEEVFRGKDELGGRSWEQRGQNRTELLSTYLKKKTNKKNLKLTTNQG